MLIYRNQSGNMSMPVIGRWPCAAWHKTPQVVVRYANTNGFQINHGKTLGFAKQTLGSLKRDLNVEMTRPFPYPPDLFSFSVFLSRRRIGTASVKRGIPAMDQCLDG